MKNGLKILIGVIAVCIILISIFASTYNGLVTKREEVKNKSADINVQLKRRADLIPNLVNTVKGYMTHEQAIIDSITESREKMINASSIKEKAKASDELTKALNNLYVVVENYPDLKANTNFIQLQDELAGTENRIATSRRDYNAAVKSYNSAVKKFPTNIIAGLFGFNEEDYFETEENVNETPKVDFNK